MSESHTLLEESDSKDIKKLVKGLAGAFGLVFGIVGGLACVILMNQIAPDFQLNSLRFIIGLTFSITSLIITRKLPKIEKKNVKWQIVVAFFNLSLNLGGYSHYLKVITFTGTRSLQIGWGIIFALILSKIILKVKIHWWRIVIIVFIISGVSMVLSSQTFQNSNCLETNPGYEIQNGSVPVVFESNPEKEWIPDAYNNSEARRIIEKTLYRDEERSFVGTFHNSSGDTVSRKDLNVPETCHTSVTTVIAIIVITLSMFCSCMESITIAGTGLRELCFWYHVFAQFSLYLRKYNYS